MKGGGKAGGLGRLGLWRKSACLSEIHNRSRSMDLIMMIPNAERDIRLTGWGGDSEGMNNNAGAVFET